MLGAIGMGPFRENAFYLLAWRAFLVALIRLVLMVTRSFELAAALLIGANVALLFSFGLIVWSELLTEELIVWTEAWRMLKPSQRPVGRAGRRWAHRCLNSVLLSVSMTGFSVPFGADYPSLPSMRRGLRATGQPPPALLTDPP